MVEMRATLQTLNSQVTSGKAELEDLVTKLHNLKIGKDRIEREVLETKTLLNDDKRQVTDIESRKEKLSGLEKTMHERENAVSKLEEERRKCVKVVKGVIPIVFNFWRLRRTLLTLTWLKWNTNVNNICAREEGSKLLDEGAKKVSERSERAVGSIEFSF